MKSLRVFSLVVFVVAAGLLSTTNLLAKSESINRSVEPRMTYAQNHALPSARIVPHRYAPAPVMLTVVVSSPAATQTTAPARVRFEVPATAEVSVGGARTTQSGNVREFLSPPLPPGKDYVYQVEVRWVENGRSVVRTREVRVSAGTQTTINFTPAASTTTVTTQPVRP